MKYLLLALITTALQVSAAVPKKVQDDLARYRSQVMELGARLTSLEKEIGTKNNLYLSSIQQIGRFEQDIKQYKQRLEELRRQVEKTKLENKRILQSYLAESDPEGTEVWQQRVHLELLKQAQVKLLSKEKELESFEIKTAGFDQKLQELRKDEEELALVINELEGRKKSAMDQYLAKVEAKKKVEGRVSKFKLQEKAAKVSAAFRKGPIRLAKPERFFKRPVEDFMAFTPSPKGVTFRYKAVQPVRATGSGRVVYAGDLASYGQVILVDHGDDLRTVVLGKMTVKVKKDDDVKDGEILGYTLVDSPEPQNLYFEVRKKNTAQNTILWLEPGSVSKI